MNALKYSISKVNKITGVNNVNRINNNSSADKLNKNKYSSISSITRPSLNNHITRLNNEKGTTNNTKNYEKNTTKNKFISLQSNLLENALFHNSDLLKSYIADNLQCNIINNAKESHKHNTIVKYKYKNNKETKEAIETYINDKTKNSQFKISQYMNKLHNTNLNNANHIKKLHMIKIFHNKIRSEEDIQLLYNYISSSNSNLKIFLNTISNYKDLYYKIYKDLVFCKAHNTTNSILYVLKATIINDDSVISKDQRRVHLLYLLKLNYFSDILMYKTWSNSIAIEIINSFIINIINDSELNKLLLYDDIYLKERDILFSLCCNECVEEVIQKSLVKLKSIYKIE